MNMPSGKYHQKLIYSNNLTSFWNSPDLKFVMLKNQHHLLSRDDYSVL